MAEDAQRAKAFYEDGVGAKLTRQPTDAASTTGSNSSVGRRKDTISDFDGRTSMEPRELGHADRLRSTGVEDGCEQSSPR